MYREQLVICTGNNLRYVHTANQHQPQHLKKAVEKLWKNTSFLVKKPLKSLLETRAHNILKRLIIFTPSAHAYEQVGHRKTLLIHMLQLKNYINRQVFNNLLTSKPDISQSTCGTGIYKSGAAVDYLWKSSLLKLTTS